MGGLYLNGSWRSRVRNCRLNLTAIVYGAVAYVCEDDNELWVNII
jgi:hypothetical protein